MHKIKAKKETKQQPLNKKILKVLITYFTTQFILMVIVGSATWGILSLMNVQYAVLLSVVTGVMSSIPTFGMLIATVIIAIVAIFDNVSMWVNSPVWLEGLVVLAVFFVFNKIVDLALAPIFLGKANKLSPLTVSLLVVFGTMFFGVWGAILAVPIYLVIRTSVEYYRSYPSF